MENNLPELVTQISDNINITGLQNLSQCLTEIKPDIEAGGTKFTIIPNIVKDITNFILNKRKINTQEKRDKMIYSLYNKNLDIQSKKDEFQFQLESKKMDINIAEIKKNTEIELTKIENMKQTTLAEIDAQKEIKLNEIYYNTYNEISKINAEREIKLQELQYNHDIKIKEIDASTEKFMTQINEESRRFSKEFKFLFKNQKNRFKVRNEALAACEFLRKKASKEKTKLDKEYIVLLKIANEAPKEDFNFITILNEACNR